MKKYLLYFPIIAAVFLGFQPAQAAELKFDFTWVGWKDKCSVKSPAFKILGAPEGTSNIHFKMKDLDYTSFSHGGGKAKYSGKDIPRGAFKYKGPCPPGGSVHKYEWTAIAQDDKGNELGRAVVIKPYPPK